MNEVNETKDKREGTEDTGQRYNNIDNRSFKQQVMRVDKVLYEAGIDPDTLEPATVKMLSDIGFYEEMFKGPEPTRAFKVVVARILKLRPVPKIDDRKHIVTLLTENYVRQTGDIPNSTQLILLANFLLVEELTNTHPDKVSRTEYPFMNKRQLRTRHRREVPDEFMGNRGNEYDAVPDKKNLTMEYTTI